jgi:hypothetical protein
MSYVEQYDEFCYVLHRTILSEVEKFVEFCVVQIRCNVQRLVLWNVRFTAGVDICFSSGHSKVISKKPQEGEPREKNSAVRKLTGRTLQICGKTKNKNPINSEIVSWTVVGLLSRIKQNLDEPC